jgi:predicted DNA-binding transcriptional regulator AlpA
VSPTVGVVHHLVGVAEVAELLGVSRQRVHKLAERDDFPAPVAILTAGKVWDRDAVEKWARATGRL